MMKTLSLHMQTNNGVSTNMGIQFNLNILLNKCINTISNEIAHLKLLQNFEFLLRKNSLYTNDNVN
jgi:hypothetical protein